MKLFILKRFHSYIIIGYRKKKNWNGERLEEGEKEERENLEIRGWEVAIK